MQNPVPNMWEVVFPNVSIEGVALVVMDRSDYIRKAKELLDDTSTSQTIQSDLTNKLKNKLINTLKRIKVDTGMQENI